VGWFAIALDWLRVVATIFDDDWATGSFGATNLAGGDTLGWSDPKYDGLVL
jgi:hypothetical protein